MKQTIKQMKLYYFLQPGGYIFGYIYYLFGSENYIKGTGWKTVERMSPRRNNSIYPRIQMNGQIWEF